MECKRVLKTPVFEKLFVKVKNTCFRKYGLYIVRRIPTKAPTYSPRAMTSILSYAKKLVHNMQLPMLFSNWVCASITMIPIEAETVCKALRGACATRGSKKAESSPRRLPATVFKVGSQVVGQSLTRCSHLVKKKH